MRHFFLIWLVVCACGVAGAQDSNPQSTDKGATTPATAQPPATQQPPPATPQRRNEAQGIMAPRQTGPDAAIDRYHFFASFKARIEDYNYFPSAKANGAYTY